jgi:3',5'-cyclic-AMP phosphodiesterase
MTKPLLVAQISDLHIKAPGELAYGKVDTAAALAACIVELNRFSPALDLVVVSGDLADTPTHGEYEHLTRLLAPLRIPYAVVPGNHDDRGMLRAHFPDQPYAAETGAFNLACEVGAIDVILLDSSVPGAPHGLLEAETLQWLDDTLAASRSRPALVFLHHPPFITGIGHMDVQNLRNADALSAVVGKHPHVRLIAAGHVHRNTMSSFAGVSATICPAPNHAVALDLDARLPPSFNVEPPAFHVHAWLPAGDGGRLVTHTVFIGDFDGPHPFFGADGRLL